MEMFRTDIHNCVYLCNYLFHALHKYRSSGDREKWYNFGRGLWSGSCYLYIVRSENVNRSGFVDVGLGLGQSPGLESFRKSPIPVQYDGCYKVMWEGRGIRNESFIYIPL